MDVIKALTDIVGEENIRTDPVELLCYSRDASVHQLFPKAVVRPSSKEEIVQIVKLANRERFPIVPRGAGTNLTGQTMLKDGVILDLTLMNHVLDLRLEDFQVIVEPGVVQLQLNEQLMKHKVFFPPDPASKKACTIGGMIANNSSGLHCVKYGTTKQYVLGLEVVLPTGHIIRTGSHVFKSVSGYDLTSLFIGSEGTLGIFTEATLKLRPSPETKLTAYAAFNDLRIAGQTVHRIMTSGVMPSAIEIMDKIAVRAVREVRGIDMPRCEALLLFEVDGDMEAVKRDMNRIKGLCDKAIEVRVATDLKEADELWNARSSLVPSFSRLDPKLKQVPIAEDMGVPISRIPDAVAGVRAIFDKHGVLGAIYGHIGDGNLHTRILIDYNSPEHWKLVRGLHDEIYEFILSLDGTVTGEHGIGITRWTFLKKEHREAVEYMRAIKNLLDPNNIMNPGKMAMTEYPKALPFVAWEAGRL